jgi:integrase
MTPIKRGKVYYAKWRCAKGYCFEHPHGGKQHYVSLRSADKREALARVGELCKKLDQQRYRNALGLPPTTVGSELTIAEYTKRYLEGTRGLKAESTWDGEHWHLKAVADYFGSDTKLMDISPMLRNEYRTKRLLEIAPKTWNSHVASIQSIFEWGVKQGWLLVNPFRGLERVKRALPTKDRYVSPERILEVIKATQDPMWKLVMQFMFATYCRSGELRRLKPEHIRRDLGYLEFVKPKEGKVKRIPLTPQLLHIVDKAIFISPAEYVFNEDGRPLSKERVYRMVRKAGTVIGVSIGPHRFRHSGITDALGNGAALAGVQSIAGHTQLSTTQGYLSLPVTAAISALRTLPED